MMDVPSQRRLGVLLARDSDALKALLIVVVVADHNDWFRRLAPALFDPLTFHVLGFFLLAFSFDRKRLDAGFILDRVARYLVPFWWALSAASLAFALVFHPPGGVADRMFSWLLAAGIGNAPFVKESSGLLMLWFLPALFGLTCLLAAFDSIRSRPVVLVASAAAIGSHLVLPLLPSPPLFWLPFGLAIALQVFVLGLLWRRLLTLALLPAWGPMAAAVLVVSYGVLVAGPVRIEIATLDLFGVDRVRLMLLQDIAGVSGVLALLWLAGLLRGIPGVRDCGRHSLLIYLLHPSIYTLLGKFWPVAPKAATGGLALLLHGCLTTFIALLGSYALSRFVRDSPTLSSWLVPRSWRGWQAVRRVGA